ncbi:MAG: Arc/MetJ-type ribon-helix-helix transcriptional regulator [Phenylobacterium sp.]|jgi:Arc/MetJ-type ribon-helix-helix transcriptional regulator
MSTITQPLDSFIDEQVKTGTVSSEIEAEKMILFAVSQRALARKLARAQEQVKNGEFYEAGDDFISNLLIEGRSRVKTVR